MFENEIRNGRAIIHSIEQAVEKSPKKSLAEALIESSNRLGKKSGRPKRRPKLKAIEMIDRIEKRSGRKTEAELKQTIESTRGAIEEEYELKSNEYVKSLRSVD